MVSLQLRYQNLLYRTYDYSGSNAFRHLFALDMQNGHFHSVSIAVWVSMLKYDLKMMNFNLKLYTFGIELSNSRSLNKKKKILKCINVMGVRIVLTLAARLEFGISSFIALKRKNAIDVVKYFDLVI